MSTKIIIGSRGSDLALWQAYHVKAQLENLNCEVEIKIIKTQGDQIQHLSFDKMEGKGFFTKEIEAALLDRSIDLAVHSHKDLETTSPAGLVVAAVSDRENPTDILLVRKESVDPTAPYKVKNGAIIGTSSARRRTQLFRLLGDVNVQDLRGNVPTRIQKLRDGQYDAIVLAHAGVLRLNINLSEFEVVEFDPTAFVPCPAQGVLALQIRENDAHLMEILAHLNSDSVKKRIHVERKILNLLDGGCQLPLGAYCPNEKEVFVSFTQNNNAASELYRFPFPKDENEIQHIVNAIKKH
jgi:hydroxymethylbilane synthase